MNRYLGVLICLAVFAVPLSAQAGNAIFTQTYSFSDVDNSWRAIKLADDFSPDFSGDVQYVVLWVVYDVAQPASIFLRITEDNGDLNPNTATLVTSGLSPATHVDTGDWYGGDIIQTTCILPTAAAVSSGKTYWLEVALPYPSYWLAQQPLVFGSTMWGYANGQFWSTQYLVQEDYDSFFELHIPLALENNTWGSIKASF
ncbi:MAG: hypothetical protein GQ565_09285 [Candidatus Aegiribacteria sp.]|nr:hypothetical protein [Candidatus Aegiribacteria sp.]